MGGSPQAASPSKSFNGFQEKILEWVAISFFRGSSKPDIKTISPALAGGFFITEPLEKHIFPITVFRETGFGANNYPN